MENNKTSAGVSADMSAEAVAARLRSAAQLYKLATSLRKAKWVGKVRGVRRRRAGEVPDKTSQ